MSTLNGHGKVEGISQPTLVQELYGGEIYEYYSLGRVHCRRAWGLWWKTDI